MPSTKSKTTLASSWQFEALGTRWSIETAEALSESDKNTLLQTVESFDSYFSRFRSDSVITSLAKQPGTAALPHAWLPLVKLYDELYNITNGAFTACVGDTLSAAGYDADYSFHEKQTKPVLRWDEVVRFDGTSLTVLQPVLLDFGAAGKGFLVDLLADLLKTNGYSTGTIDASGDVYTWGDHSERIGLEDPNDTARVLGSIHIQNASLCASATNRRRWSEQWHHIIQPETSRSTTGIQAVWTVAPTAMQADAATTILFVGGPESLKTLNVTEWVRVHDDGSLDYSPGFSGQLYT